MALMHEEDFPAGHPARHDYDPKSKEAKDWLRHNSHPRGERDWPVDHPKAVDTKGNTNHVPQRAGVDPARPYHEEFTGRSPEQADAVRTLNEKRAQEARDSIAPPPTVAPDPPPPGDISEPVGQPSVPPVKRTHPAHHRKNK